mgnify:CR=1 FL=1
MQEDHQILIMIVGDIASVLAGRAAQDGVRQLIAVCVHLVASVNKGMGMLGGIDGI